MSKYSPRDLIRFWTKVRLSKDCWEWIGHKNIGYGVFWFNGKNRRAHRVSYELLNGSISEELVIDHVCRNRACVNPDHLDQVPTHENLRRGEGFVGKNFRKKYCDYGHPLFGKNLTFWKSKRTVSGVVRVCKRCRVIYRGKQRNAEIKK